MARQDPADYGEHIAAVYDDLFGGMIDTDQAVETLAGLAGKGPVLELGIGTGRLALPLAGRGIEVHGVDASEAMVARLRAKPGGQDIPVAMDDFRDVPVEGTYPLVVLAFNTIFALLSQEDQLRCFRAVAQHLTTEGGFVLEAFVPDMTRWQNNQATQTTRLEDGRLLLETSLHDAPNQRIDSSLNLMGEDGIRMYPVHIRYAWPAELDLMARLGGLSLQERWGGWDRRPFDSFSTKHVSVYRASSA
jgi:SAM-dependent methyltransferase